MIEDLEPGKDTFNETQQAYNEAIETVNPETSQILTNIKEWIDAQRTVIDQADYKYKWEDDYKDFPIITDKITAETRIVGKSNNNGYFNRYGSRLRRALPGKIISIIPRGIFYEDDRSRYKIQLDRYKKIYEDLTQLYLNDSITDIELEALIGFLKNDETITKSENKAEPLVFIEQMLDFINKKSIVKQKAETTDTINSINTQPEPSKQLNWFQRTISIAKNIVHPPR